MNRSESTTRQEQIARQLAKAGWGVKSRSAIEEFLVEARRHVVMCRSLTVAMSLERIIAVLTK